MNRSFAELCQIRSLIIEKDSGQYSYPELYLSRSNSRITTAYQLDCNAVACEKDFEIRCWQKDFNKS